ncbi:MAG: multidrug efflux RND transporter permease subunit [Pseudomonadota bacterium]
MSFSQFFISRPIFAIVISAFITIIGAISYFALPVAQYPQVAPPTIQVTAQYPGADAETLARTVATPLEQQINGVEGMIYLGSEATGDGNLTITVTFELGTDLDQAQVLVQNRVAIAEPRLPEQVRRLGLTTRKASPDLLLVVHMFSPDGSRDDLYITSAAQTVRDQLSRLSGVGNVTIFGARDYAMRIWLNPDRIAGLGMTPGEVLEAVRAQNAQVASGVLNQQPTADAATFELSVRTAGRLIEAEEFERIIVKRGEDGRIVRLGDVARVQLGAQNYTTRAYLDGKPAVAILVNQRPGSNALATAQEVLSTVKGLSASFPEGLAYDVIYNPTTFIQASIDAVVATMSEAILLVVAVVILFLGTWRAALVPILAIPVSLVGTFAVMAAFGYSINNLSLFGLVLAVGIVVDDAIIVVEGIEKHVRNGMRPIDAAKRTMREVSGALIATSLVLAAVFIPTAGVPGISGQFYQQFALTITAATAISLLVSLTLSPALSAMLLKPEADYKPGLLMRPITWGLQRFNASFDWLSDRYAATTKRLIRLPLIVLIVYGGLLFATNSQFAKVPMGFIPQQDQGYYITVVQLPPGSSLDRTDKVIRSAIDDLLAIDGVAHAAAFSGLNGATRTTETNTGVIFFTTTPFEKRAETGYDPTRVLAEARAKMSKIADAAVFIIEPPPVRGIGNGGGFKMMLQDRANLGPVALEEAARRLVAAANADPLLQGVFTLYSTGTPRIFANIDRERAEMLNVPVQRIHEALEVYLGSAFVNDFNLLGRTYRVTAQADASYRQTPEDVARLRTRSNSGVMVPLGAVATLEHSSGPLRQPRYNLYQAASIQGRPAPGVSSSEALVRLEQLAAKHLPPGIGFEWTELAYQEKNTGNTATLVFALAVLFVFLVLAAQYESWALPAAVILIVPMVLLSGITGVDLRGFDNNVLVQIGFVVLVALASKNAILIVEFAKQAEQERRIDRFQAAVEAARSRLRPIVMTSLAFILGVLPLMMATGAGAEMRQALGTSVFSGMLGVTVFGLVFTPVFYVVMRAVEQRLMRKRDDKGTTSVTAGAEPTIADLYQQS